MPAPKNRPYTTPNNNIPVGSFKCSKSAAPKKYPREFDTKRTAESFKADVNVRNPVAITKAINIDPATVQTNILIFDVSGTGMPAQDFTKKLGDRNILAGPVNRELMRFVTHCDINRADCQHALEAVESICGAKSAVLSS